MTHRFRGGLELLHVVAAWAIVLIGVLHVFVTFVGYDAANLEALWFAGSGLAVVLIGVLHLLAATAARHVKVVRVAAVGASTAGIVLAITFTVLTGWTEPQGPVLLALFALSGALTLSRRIERSAERSATIGVSRS